MKKKVIKAVGLVIGLLIVWFLIKDIIDNWADIVPYLTHMKTVLFVVSVLIYGIAFLFTGYNWSYLLWKMEKGPGRIEYLNAHMVSALARYIPGGIWSIVGKAFFCNQMGVGKKAATVSIILEYVFQIVSSGLFFLLLLPFLFGSGMPVWLLCLLVIGLLVILVILPWCINLGIRILSKIMKKDCGDIRLERKFVYQILARYMGAWVVTGIGLVVLVSAFSDVTVKEGIFVALSYPVSWVAGFLSPSPNGMGIREAILRLLLTGRQAAQLVLLIVVTSRIWTIFGELAAFGGFKLFYLSRRKRPPL